MKKSLFIAISALMLFQSAQAQEVKYRRPTLSMVAATTESKPFLFELFNLEMTLPEGFSQMVTNSWNGYTFPDKYNKHNISNFSINLNDPKLQPTDAEMKQAGFELKNIKGEPQILKAQLAFKNLRKENDGSYTELPSEKEYNNLIIAKSLKDNKVANQIVASWYGLKDGKFDNTLSLIEERGCYDATQLDLMQAKGQARGMSLLSDAGVELIENTFLTVTKLEFYPNEPIAKFICDKTITLASANPLTAAAAKVAAEETYNATKEGYTIASKTFLYKLVWTDSIRNVFETQYWDKPDEFMKSDFVKLELVNAQFNTTTLVSKAEKKSETEIVNEAVVRNIDAAFTKLQKQNPVFMPMMPITSVNPIIVQIGEKESITKKSKFAVYEYVWNEEKANVELKKVGACKLDKEKPIWDNRYFVGNDAKQQKDEQGNPVTGTTFKGSKKIKVGMMLKQIK